MFLDTVSTIDDTKRSLSAIADTPPVYARWECFPFTGFLHHGHRCCDAALAWLQGMDRARLYGESLYSGPRWLRSLYDWGPMQHPAYWCEALRLKTLDCGGQAAVAREVFRTRGLEVLPLQIVQQYNPDNVAHWRCGWEEKNCNAHWINDDWIYHEGCALILPDDKLKCWDASSSCWLEPEKTKGYGSIAALKVSSPGVAIAAERRWGRHRIPENQWVMLE